jgi:protein-tyrosine kinase
MTDNPRESLNLVERMAKRMAAEAAQGVSAQPVTPSFAERVAQKVGTGSAAAPPVGQGAASKNGQGLTESRPSNAAVAVAPVSAKVPAAGNVDEASTNPTIKQIGLDFRALRQNGMITPDNLSSALSNEFRGIKRKLLQKVRDPKTRAAVNNLIMVTSSLPGEGKTFSSINLAISLAAERGLRVLLIDADVIRPSVGNMFVSPVSEGLTDLLSGKVRQVSDVLYRCTDVPNLSVIFSGNPKTNSPELISSGQMANLCHELSARYPDRVIVLDTPPVLASSEPAILATYVHQLIMVVSAAQTDRHQLRKSLEAVSSCQNISLLFNKAPRWNEVEYNSYYGYGYNTPPSPTDSAASQADSAASQT